MGSERLSHLFTALDPTHKKKSSSTIDENENPSPHHSLSHTSGTQPVSMSNGPKSSPSSSIIKHKLKTNPKYKKLIKLHSRQLSHITTTLNAIESLSKTDNIHENEILQSNKIRADKLQDKLENFRNTPSKQDHEHFDALKTEIDELINDLKSYKVDNNNSDSRNTIDHLIGFPLDVSDNETDNNEEDETLVYL